MQNTLTDYLHSFRVHAATIKSRPSLKPEPPPPVLEQVRAILAQMPPQPVSLDAIRRQLVGRFGRPPQRGEVAVALKLLNFTPMRIWRKGYDGRHFWLTHSFSPQNLPVSRINSR